MKKISLSLTDRQYAELKQRVKSVEILMTEQIRRAIDDYLEKEKIKNHE